MADELPTVASFPAGFATLTGIIYAVIATPKIVRSNTCWSKMAAAGVRLRGRVHPDFSLNQTIGFRGNHQSETLSIVCYALAREVTQSLQRIRKHPVEGAPVEERIAVLHILAQLHGSPCVDEETTASNHDLDTSSPMTSFDSDSEPTSSVHKTIDSMEESFPKLISTSQINSTWEHIIKVRVIGYESRDIVITEKILLNWTNNVLSKFSNFRNKTLTYHDFHHLIAANDRSIALPTAISAQCAGTWDVWLMEAGYKGIEILFGAGIVLGSTGGAWLALTLSSIFPQRLAAGIYARSFGQSIKHEEENTLSSSIFIPPGTSWVEGAKGYCIRPCLRWPWFDDATRNLLGYLTQFSLLYLLTWFKRTIRVVAFSEPYSQTVDTVRYVMLVVLPFVLLVSLSWLKRPFNWQRSFLLCIYLILWSAAIVCVIFGQGELDRVWGIRFQKIPRLVEPIASIGAVVAIYLGAKPSDPNIHPEIWGLIWAIGVCTVVW